MSRLRALGLTALLACVTACGQSSAPQAPTKGGPQGPTANTGTVPSTSSQAPADLGPTPAGESVAFTVSLHLPNEAAMNTYVAGLATPGSASYRKYLTPQEFGARFGLPQAAIDGVVAWLNGAGLATTRAPQRTSITAQGTADQVNRLLGITLADRLTADGQRYHVPVGAPAVPPSLRADVEALVGLDTEPVQRPSIGHIYMSGVPADGLTPDIVASAYEISPLHDAGINGAGMSIAIISYDTFTPSDMDRFDQQMGITGAPEVKRVALPGAEDTPGDGTGEVALDLQVIRGIAPMAQIYDYEGPNVAGGMAAIVAKIVSDGKVKIVSNSWGTCENRDSKDAMRAEERELAAAFAAGISIFTASGDDAAYDCRGLNIFQDPFERDISPSVDWPAASANVIGVGGTFLTVRQDGTYYEEAGWEEPLGGGGSGGGVSKYQDRPDWQTGTGVDNAQSTGKRQVPDVAGPADPTSGFYVTYTDPGNGPGSGRVGGTSAASPFWGGSMLLAQQYAQTQGVSALGPLGPVLYQVAAQQPDAFHDVIKGGNLLFQTGPGWDYATGLGSPRVAPLAQAIADFLKQ